MYRIMIVDAACEERRKIIGMLSHKYDIITSDNREDAVAILDRKLSEISLIIINVSKPVVDGQGLLDWLSKTGKLEKIPAIILLENVKDCDMETAFKKGAIDYITYDLGEVIICHRVEQFIGRSTNRLSTADKLLPTNKDAYIFNNCMGAAMLVDYDGNDIQLLQVNEVFYNVVKRDKNSFDKKDFNLLEIVTPDDEEAVRRALDEASIKGYASCEVHNSTTEQAFRMMYHHISTGEDGNIFLVLVQDITDLINATMRVRALAELPGTILFDYDPIADLMTIHVSNSDDFYKITSRGILRGSKRKKWISPESENRVLKILKKAMDRPVSGVIDFQGSFEQQPPYYYHWHRAHYRSLSDGNGKVFRIIGRVDDVERNVWSGLTYEDSGLYDATTRLLTFHALKSYIKKALGERHSGILMVLDMNGFDDFYEETGSMMGDLIMEEFANALRKLFFKHDIFGKFGSEEFIFFLPEAYSANVARRKARIILNAIDQIIEKHQIRGIDCNIGIAIAKNHNDTVADLLNQANTAMSHSKKNPDTRYAIYSPRENKIPVLNVEEAY